MSAHRKTKDNQQTKLLHLAFGLAVTAHLLLVALLPTIPELTIPSIHRGKTITVFLRRPPTPEPFRQSLNTPGGSAPHSPNELHTAGGLPAIQAGAAETISDPAPEIDSHRQDRSRSTPTGQQIDPATTPRVFITNAMVTVFAQQEAFMKAEGNPEALQRFKRSFSSYARYHRRPRTENFTNIYGDYYQRTSNSNGDICFLQQREQLPDDFSKNTVYFYRCGRKPLNFGEGLQQ